MRFFIARKMELLMKRLKNVFLRLKRKYWDNELIENDPSSPLIFIGFKKKKLRTFIKYISPLFIKSIKWLAVLIITIFLTKLISDFFNIS